jgi:hypothetical protein
LDKKITMDELKKKVEGVLGLAPDLNAGEVWLALMKKYPYSAIEKIIDERNKEIIENLRNEEAEIKVVDDNGNEISLEEYINDKEQKKQK